MWGALLPPDMAVHFFQSFTQNGGFQSHGCTAKWLLCIREHPIKMDYLGVPPFIETPNGVQQQVGQQCRFMSQGGGLLVVMSQV